jgi:hypothetical protein
MSLIQLKPMIPVFVPEFNLEGFAFLVESLSEEHYTYFTIAMDNGEIWTLDNTKVRFCINKSQNRNRINKESKSELI